MQAAASDEGLLKVIHALEGRGYSCTSSMRKQAASVAAGWVQDKGSTIIMDNLTNQVVRMGGFVRTGRDFNCDGMGGGGVID